MKSGNTKSLEDIFKPWMPVLSHGDFDALVALRDAAALLITRLH